MVVLALLLGTAHAQSTQIPAQAPAEFAQKLAAAQKGDTLAQYEVGYFYHELNNNPTAAAPWFEKAAQGGHTGAMVYLGVMYEEGIGVKKDAALAKKYYQMGCDKGDTNACEDLALVGK